MYYLNIHLILNFLVCACPLCKSLLFSAYLKFLLLEHFLFHNIEHSPTHFFSTGKIIHILGYADLEVSVLW